MRFFSKFKELRLVVIPRRKVMLESGETFLKEGKTLEFIDGVFETHDPTEIDFIKAHPFYGNSVTSYDPSVELLPLKEAVKRLKSQLSVAEGGKRTFKCLLCGDGPFKSGKEVAAHRKEFHAEQIKDIEVLEESEGIDLEKEG